MVSMVIYADTYEELKESIKKLGGKRNNIALFKMSANYLRLGFVKRGKIKLRSEKHPLYSKMFKLSVGSLVRMLRSYPKVLETVGSDPWVCVTEITGE